jgi:hypothetical protein
MTHITRQAKVALRAGLAIARLCLRRYALELVNKYE